MGGEAAPPVEHRPLTLVVAVAENGVIGRDSHLPFRLPSDLKRFRALTWGKPLLMGRRTFTSIGKALPGRISVVVSTDPAFTVPDGVIRAFDLASGIAAADAAAATLGASEIMVIGGERLFEATLPLARTLHLTRVHGEPEGDVFFFPSLDPAQWREVDRGGPFQEAGDEMAYTVITLERAPDK